MNIDAALKWADTWGRVDSDPPNGDAHAMTALAAEVRRLRIGHARYEIVRTLNVREFRDIYQRNIAGAGRFDDLIDAVARDRMTQGGGKS